MTNKQNESNLGGYLLPNDEIAKVKMTPSICFTGYVDEEPTGFSITPSIGWKDQFHVIIEYGDSEDWTHKLMSREQILQKYGIKIPEVSLAKMIKENPNECDLGASIRKLHNDVVNKF